MNASRRSLPYRIVQSKTLAVVLVVIAAISFFRFSRELMIRIRFTQQINELKQEITSLQGQQNNLSSLIEFLGTDAYIESEARKKLSMQKSGEQLVVVPDAIKTPADLNENTGSNSAHRWWRYFFDYGY